MKQVLFAHGKEGSPNGTKATMINDNFAATIPSLKNSYAESDFAGDLALIEMFSGYCTVLVGSSRGGALMTAANADKRKILICPAWKRFGVVPRLRKTDIIIHSKKDKLVPYRDSEILAGMFGCTLIEAGHDHRMGDKKTLQLIMSTIQKALKGEKQ